MKKTEKTALIAAAFAAALTMSACDKNSSSSSGSEAPGADDIESKYLPETEDVEVVYGPPPSERYDPESEEQQDVYGPPVDFDGEDSSDSYTVSEDSAIYDPEGDNIQVVYGPPAE